MQKSGQNKWGFSVRKIRGCKFCGIIEKVKEAEAGGLIQALEICDSEHILHYDGDYLAILDKFPCCTGHILIMPVKHYPRLEDVPHLDYISLMGITARVAEAAVKALGLTDYNIILNNGQLAGQGINHIHWHILPRSKKDGIKLKQDVIKFEGVSMQAIYQRVLKEVQYGSMTIGGRTSAKLV
jgi:histidine triad (HIT) family protein